MKVLAFVDLDDTLFQTRPKCPPGEHRRVSVDAAGGGGSFMTAKQERFLSRLLRDALVVPTTGRSLAGLRRVSLTWADHAIADHGATIVLPNGAVDAAWGERTREVALRHEARLAEALALLADLAAPHDGLRVTAHREHGVPVYALAKADRPDHPALPELREAALGFAAQGETWHAFASGRAVTLIPRDLGKAAAVREVLARHGGEGEVLTLGIGDALSDTPFMALCDYAVTPRGSQILRLLAGEHHVRA